ncbi:hypothetical protein C8R43DRAFT_1041063 [Mycena crocata]|nr:hypothetical protein C8R43DRAFT_1041063 [Mycena crocata]
MPLTDQPAETLDQIVSLIHLTSDLLSLALACKSLNTIIIPDHLEFRHVRCDPRRQNLWRALAQRPLSATRIHTLELLPESTAFHPLVQKPLFIDPVSTPLVPKSVIANVHAMSALPYCMRDLCGLSCGEECEKVLASAIAQMQGLYRLGWNHNQFLQTHAPIAPIFESLLQTCPNLRELEITHHDVSRGYFHSFFPPAWKSTNLTLVSLSVRRARVSVLEPYKHLPDMFLMLSHCPSLHDLRLAFESRDEIDMDPLFEHGKWPQLTRLILEGDIQSPPISMLNNFIRYHTHMEILSLPQKWIPRPLPALPRLRWLSSPDMRRHISNGLHFPHLEYVEMTKASSGFPTTSDLSMSMDRLRSFPALRGITTSIQSRTMLQRLADTVPHLERLSLAAAPWNQRRFSYGDRENHIPSPEYLAILSMFKNLTHLDSAAMLKANADGEFADIDDLLLDLADALPQLRYVCVDFNDDRKPTPIWITLMRDPDGVLVSWTKTRKLASVRLHNWEDVSRDIGIS